MKKPKDQPSPRSLKFLKTACFAIGISIWVGAVIIVTQLVIGFLLLFILGEKTFTEPVPTAIYSALSYIVAMLIILFTPILFKKTTKLPNRKELGLRDLPTWIDIGLAPIGFIVYLLFAAGLTALFSIFPWFNAEEVQNVGFSTYISGFDRIVAFFILVVIAPIFEELIFRGWLYSKLRKKINENYSNIASTIISIILVSILFGAIHMQWNVGVNVFAMSIVLCAMREITGTIYSGIILHMLKNGIAFYLLYVIGM